MNRANIPRQNAARAARVLAYLCDTGATLTTTQLMSRLGLKRHGVQRALLLLVDAKPSLVLADVEQGFATQARPPGSTYRYSAVADPAWPEWLPEPQEAPLRAAEGGIVASALRCAAPSVWAWAGRVA